MQSNPELEELIRRSGAKVLTTQVPGFGSAPPPTPAEPIKPAPASKYGNVRTEYRTLKFDSQSEAKRAEQLDMLVAAGEIIYWLPQVKFRLGCPLNIYVVDFLVFSDKWCHAEDVKGIETPKFRRDRKLWREYGPVPLWIIKGGDVEVIPASESPRW